MKTLFLFLLLACPIVARAQWVGLEPYQYGGDSSVVHNPNLIFYNDSSLTWISCHDNWMGSIWYRRTTRDEADSVSFFLKTYRAVGVQVAHEGHILESVNIDSTFDGPFLWREYKFPLRGDGRTSLRYLVQIPFIVNDSTYNTQYAPVFVGRANLHLVVKEGVFREEHRHERPSTWFTLPLGAETTDTISPGLYENSEGRKKIVP